MGIFINQNNILAAAKQDILKILHSTKECAAALEENLIFPPKPDLGDLSFPLFTTAQQQGLAPGKLAQDLQRKLKPQGLIEKISAVGPYLNFWFKRDRFAKEIITPPAPPLTFPPKADPPWEERGGNKKILPLRVRGSERGLRNQKIMVEMISPNNNKPLHLGHLRNAFIGESVSRLLEAQGAKVIRACLFNDRGLQFNKSMLAYQKWGNKKTPKSTGLKGDKFVVQWYVKFSEESKNNPELEIRAKEMVKLWEQGDKKTLALWKKMSGWANQGIGETFKKIGIKFDKVYFEHKLWKKGKAVAVQGLKKGIFKKDETGAIIAEFAKSGSSASVVEAELPPKVLLRSDGTAIYTTTDLILGELKFKQYKLDHSIWCVGQEQDLAFKQLFEIYRMLGYKWYKNCEHLSYKHVYLPEGSMKTREGTVVEADDLLDEVDNLVVQEVKARHKDLQAKEITKRAKILSQAAIRYYLLHIDPESDVNFDPQQSIAFTGNTGPYLLYTYARIASILRKAKTKKLSFEREKAKLWTTISNLEWRLILQLARFSEITSQAAQRRDPSHLAKYLYDLTRVFSDFYETSPILQAEEPTRAFRLALIKKFQTILKQGLYLLTIETVEEM